MLFLFIDALKNMRKIEKKVWPEYFEQILSGEKTFEVRLNDWTCNTGDLLLLREWDPSKKEYTGRFVKKKITYIVKTKDMRKFFTKKDIEKYGFQIIGFK